MNSISISREHKHSAVFLGKLDTFGRLRAGDTASDLIPSINLIVSFSNVWPYGFTVALLNTRTGFFTYIGQGEDRQEFVGASGIAKTRNGGFLLVDQRGWDGQSGYTIFDRHLQVIDSIDLGYHLDLHDIAPFKGGLAFANTARDEVLLSRSGKPTRQLYSAATNSDSLHLNGLTTRNGKLFASMFGPKREESWRNAQDGQIIECETGRVVASGINQPHSPTATPDGFWICESAAGQLLHFDAYGNRTVKAQLKGYLRGLHIDNRIIIVGASAQRQKSRHLGVNIEAEDTSNHINASRIYVIDRKTRMVWSRDITHIGHEIFAMKTYKGPLRPSLETTLQSMQARVMKASA